MGRAFEFRKARKLKRWSNMAKTFTRIGKDIVVAVKDGGSNPESNSKLRAIIQNAKAANMPKENIFRAIKNASVKKNENFKELTLEGYGPHGIAVIIECTTDNNNRTVANIRSYFKKTNGQLGTAGSVEFMFKRYSVFKIKAEINLLNLIINGDQTPNIRIFDGDSIFIPKNDNPIKDQIVAINKTNINPDPKFPTDKKVTTIAIAIPAIPK